MTHDAEVTDTRPVFVIPVLPAEVPAALLALPNEAGVLYVNASMAGLSGSGVGRAAGLVESIRQTIERQRKGRFWLHEAAQILADAHGLDAPQLLRRMKGAFRLGGLRVRDPATGTLRIPGEVELTFHNMFVTPADIDGWLTQDGADYRFPVAPHTASAPAVAPPEPVAATAEAVTVSGAGGDETLVQRRERLQQRVDYWKAQGVRDFTKRVAKEEDVTVARIRQILDKGKTKPATAKQKAKPRPPATFCSGLMTPVGRAR